MAIDHRYRYISDAVWSPTYVSVVALILGTINNSGLATVASLLSLVVSRVFLELLYRVAFGEARLQLRTQLATFGLQLLVWGAVWGWYVQRTNVT
jgi:hypothetical protein